MTFVRLPRPSSRQAVALAAAGPAAMGAMLRAPATARRHPKSREVQSLRRSGWSVERVLLSPSPTRAAVRLVKGPDAREIADNDLAFAAYAAALRTRLDRSRSETDGR